MKKTNIKLLWISPFSPISTSAEAGGQTFNYYFKRISSDSRFDVRLIACGLDTQREAIEYENKDIVRFVSYPAGSFWGKVKRLYNIESKYNIFNRYANQLSNHFVLTALKVMKTWKKGGYDPDVVVFEWTSALFLAKELKKIFPKSIFVASEHDVTFVGYGRKKEYYSGIRKVLWAYRYRKIKKMELQNLTICDLVLPHNMENKDVLVKEGIFPDKIQWLTPFFYDMTSKERNSNSKDILFYGAMSRMENHLSAVWFVDNVMPKLSDLDVRFVIVGSNPSDELRALECDKIHITGFVQDVSRFFENSMCFVAPLVLGAGIKVKVLEALSSGIPVLTNSIGIEGIPAKHEKEYFCCNSAEEYETIIRKLYAGEIPTDKLASNARKLIVDEFSVEESCARYIDRIISLVE